jgi:3D-(3,5/4)-trihydroxycyclohexane-1,2-dione acylhydrolase (decyclizing)
MAQALILYLSNQYVERDGTENAFFAGVWGIFGHGNVAGVGQALQQFADRIRYFQCRNEQAAVHAAIAYAKQKNRMQTFACTSSIGPGATNMVTGAAVATVNRIPVLLIPGDIFAERKQGPVLQQLESEHTQDIGVNDCFKPVSRYWDRIYRPEQLLIALPEAMRVLTSPAETGAVTLALPQDVQTMAYDYPEEMFVKKVWHIARNRPDAALVRKAADLVKASRAPIIVAGGGVHYSGANDALKAFVEKTGIPIGETQAGKGALPYDHPLNLGAIGTTGTQGANVVARDADLVIGIGTRYSDFTTASKTQFQNPAVRFVNINAAAMDAFKHAGVGLTGDARATLEELAAAVGDYAVPAAYRSRAAELNKEWDREVARIYGIRHKPALSQGQVVGAVNDWCGPRDVVVCAAGSLPGDLHKLWRTRDPRGYHMEYGYSCMGYEIAGGMGVKMADPSREVTVMIGDGSFLMMASEIVTMVQEGIKLTIVMLDNHGFASIGGLSESVGSAAFGAEYRYRGAGGRLDGAPLPVDYAANCASLGAHVIKAADHAALVAALEKARGIQGKPVCIVVETDRRQRVGGYESWWDVAVAEVSENPEVRKAREDYEKQKKRERIFF